MHREEAKLKRTSVLVAALAIITIAITTSADARTFRFDYHKELPIESSSQLRIINDHGTITIVGSVDVDRLVVDMVKTVRAVDEDAAKEVAELVELQMATNGDVTNIETKLHEPDSRRRSFWDRLVGSDDDWFETVDYVITAPHTMLVDISHINGKLDISGISSDINISTSAADVTAKNISGNVTLDLLSGMVTLSEITGDVEITSTRSEKSLTGITGTVTINGGSGNLTSEYIQGAMTIVQTSGNVTLTELSGNARIKTTSGKVSVEQNSGALDVFTHNGQIKAKTELFSDNPYSFETLTGKIELSFPKNVGANVHLRSASGAIDTRGVPLEATEFSRQEIKGVIAAGGPEVSIKSEAGDIQIKRY